jgi:3-dehydroquinate dehydratase / shikimate dehydrogenase
MSRSEHTHLICPLTATTPEAMRDAMTQAIDAGATAIEYRLDFLAEHPNDDVLTELLRDVPVDTIVTYRPTRQGGKYEGDEAARLATLTRAAELGATFIDVEDDVPLADQPEGNVILSYHNFDTLPADIAARAATIDAHSPAITKLACRTDHPADAMTMLDLIDATDTPTLALAMGEAGVLTRLLAGRCGGAGTFAALASDATSAPGQPTLTDMLGLYRFDRISAGAEVYGVIGCPVAHSMSPAIHNTAFDALDYDAIYLPLLVEPGEESFNRLMDAMVARPHLGFRGLSVTIPHKENALAWVGADRCDDLSASIGAINTISLAEDGTVTGTNTDYAAAIDALCDAMGIAREGLSEYRAAVIGAGGEARAIVAALNHYGCVPTIYNRTLSRAEVIADRFGGTALPLDALPTLDAQIVINCTPVGMHPHIDACPLETIPPMVEVVFDTIYNPLETQLLAQARQRGLLTVSGIEMFVNQAVAQFELWTQRPAPRDVMRQVVLERLAQTHT